MLTVGQVIADRFRLEQELGAPAAGPLWRAVDLERKRPVSLQCLNDPALGDLQALASIRETLAGVRGGAIAKVLDVTATPGQQGYLILNAMNGRSLSEWLGQGAVFCTVADWIRVWSSVLDGLAALHTVGIAHGQLSPHEVLVTSPGNFPKLVGFGELTAPNLNGVVMAGSSAFAHYAPPELARTGASVQGDVFSMAAMAYQVLAGTLPRSSASGVTPLHELRPELGQALSEWVQRGLAPEPGERFADAREMRSELGRASFKTEDPSGLSLALPMDFDGSEAQSQHDATTAHPEDANLENTAEYPAPTTRPDMLAVRAALAADQQAVALEHPKPPKSGRGRSVDEETVQAPVPGMALGPAPKDPFEATTVSSQLPDTVVMNSRHSVPSKRRRAVWLLALTGVLLSAAAGLAVWLSGGSTARPSRSSARATETRMVDGQSAPLPDTSNHAQPSTGAAAGENAEPETLGSAEAEHNPAPAPDRAEPKSRATSERHERSDRRSRSERHRGRRHRRRQRRKTKLLTDPGF